MADGTLAPSAALRRLVNGYQLTAAIYVAVRLGIADLLTDGARTSDELAAQTETHAPSLYRLLRALAAAEILHEDDGRSFSLTELGFHLRTDVTQTVAGWAAFVGRPYHWATWSSLEHSIRTGEDAFAHVHGTDAWSYRTDHPDEGEIFDAAMTSNVRVLNKAVLDAYDFGRYGTVVDVGGNRGALLAALLARYPAMHGVVFDLPEVVAGAPELLGGAGVADRCDIVAGSFFEDVPGGGDAYVLKAIVHDWDDPQATSIMQVCRRAMPADATLLVIERVIEPPNEGPEGKFSDLNMLVGLGGRERTAEEFESLFAAGGFRLVQTVASASGLSVLEGAPLRGE